MLSQETEMPLVIFEKWFYKLDLWVLRIEPS